MGRLTTIEDLEKKETAQDDEQMRAAQEAMASSRSKANAQASVASSKPGTHASRPEVLQAAQKAERQTAAGGPSKSQAQQEVDFHGLDSLEKKSGGHIALIVVAVVIVVAAALKIANVF